MEKWGPGERWADGLGRERLTEGLQREPEIRWLLRRFSGLRASYLTAVMFHECLGSIPSPESYLLPQLCSQARRGHSFSARSSTWPTNCS